MEQQVQVRGADGSILWVGTAVVGVSYIGISSEASATAVMGEGVRWDATGGVLPRQETTAAGASPAADLPMSLNLAFVRSSAGTGDVNFMGVTLEPVAAAKRGLIAGAGSLVTVITTATALTLGFKIGSSATAGQMAAVTSSTTLGTVLGIVFKINTAGATGTGTTGFAGVLVNPC